MRSTVSVLLLLFYVWATAFLENDAGGRIVPADILLVVIILLVFFGALIRGALYVSNVHFYAVPMLVVFWFGAVLSKDPGNASFELLILVFCFVGSIAIIDLLLRLPDAWIQRFFQGYMLVLGILAMICLIDFLVMPGLISSRALGGLQGPFRNTGQAGSFFGVHAAICLALLLSGVVSRKMINFGCVLLVCLALLCTLKRASSFGFVIGLVFLTIQLFFSSSKQDKKIGLYFTAAGFFALMLGTVFFAWAMDNVSDMRWRFESKFSSNVIEGVSEGFIADNIRSALTAFADSPLYGVGLNGVVGVYQSHEIHSTYFAIIAYGGVLGVLSYVFFMYSLTMKMWAALSIKSSNCYALFLGYLFPMFLGLLVSWGYTTHWRKREFWLLLAFIVVASALMRRLNNGSQVLVSEPPARL